MDVERGRAAGGGLLEAADELEPCEGHTHPVDRRLVAGRRERGSQGSEIDEGRPEEKDVEMDAYYNSDEMETVVSAADEGLMEHEACAHKLDPNAKEASTNDGEEDEEEEEVEEEEEELDETTFVNQSELGPNFGEDEKRPRDRLGQEQCPGRGRSYFRGSDGTQAESMATQHNTVNDSWYINYSGIIVILPIIFNAFQEEQLERAYQRYSHGQRQKSLVIAHLIDFLLKFSLMSLPMIFLAQRLPHASQNSLTLNLDPVLNSFELNSGNNSRVGGLVNLSDKIGDININRKETSENNSNNNNSKLTSLFIDEEVFLDNFSESDKNSTSQEQISQRKPSASRPMVLILPVDHFQFRGDNDLLRENVETRAKVNGDSGVTLVQFSLESLILDDYTRGSEAGISGDIFIQSYLFGPLASGLRNFTKQVLSSIKANRGPLIYSYLPKKSPRPHDESPVHSQEHQSQNKHTLRQPELKANQRHSQMLEHSHVKEEDELKRDESDEIYPNFSLRQVLILTNWRIYLLPSLFASFNMLIMLTCSCVPHRYLTNKLGYLALVTWLLMSIQSYLVYNSNETDKEETLARLESNSRELRQIVSEFSP